MRRMRSSTFLVLAMGLFITALHLAWRVLA